MDLNEVEYLSKKKIQALNKCNLFSVEDVLLYFPTRFEDHTIIPYSECTLGKTCTIAGISEGKATVVNTKSNLSVMNFYLNVDDTVVRVTIFNRHFLKNQIFYGKYICVTGKFDGTMDHFIASEITFEEFSNDITPVFNIKGIDDKALLELKEKLYYDYYDLIEEDIPQDILDEYNLVPINKAIKYVNIPDSMDQARKAIERFKFEELLKFELCVKYMLYKRKNDPNGVCIEYNKEKVDKFISDLPFTLTPDQVTSVNAILNDISSPYKMNRLLQGEVGSGKTVVAAIALYAVTTASFQGAIMVPTEILAFQHAQTFKDLFKDTDLKVELLTSSVTASKKNEILTGLKDGSINIVIGTHSLIQKEVEFNKLGLVITDEEHRFGVKQRVTMVGKGYLIDHLKMSATPIPRTLAISVLGDSDFSTIKTLPGQKKKVVTKYYDYTHYNEVLNFIKSQVNDGHQAYIICPTIEESEALSLQNVLNVFEEVKAYYKGQISVGLVHGKLKTEEKEEIMTKFQNNEINVLVSTSVIEVGVNVVNATTILILDADRFGIAQLHQMRGRVRRSDDIPYCFLLSDSTVENSIKRMKLIEDVSDGFILAQEDLSMRGGGEIFGEKQSGNQTFKLANIIVDTDILEATSALASDIIESGRIFKEEYKNLHEIANDNYQKRKEILE